MTSNRTFDLPNPPARFFYNRFWLRKLRRWGWSYVEAGLIAQQIARDCYLRPYNLHVQILREAAVTYRHPDPDKMLPILRSMRRPNSG